MTGIKVVDLLAPYAKGGKIGLFGGAGVGKTVSTCCCVVRSRRWPSLDFVHSSLPVIIRVYVL